MVEIKAPKDIDVSLGPQEVNADNVPYWCHHAKELKGSVKAKAQRFLKHDLIRYVGDDPEYSSKYTFICLPLNTDEELVDKETGKVFVKQAYESDYNKNIYKIYKNESGVFECNCQGWQTKARKGEIGEDGCHCAHVLALFYAFKIKKFKRGE